MHQHCYNLRPSPVPVHCQDAVSFPHGSADVQKRKVLEDELLGLTSLSAWFLLFTQVELTVLRSWGLAGVQKMKGREGELWGLSNLLAFTGDTIKTLDVLDAHTQKVWARFFHK